MKEISANHQGVSVAQIALRWVIEKRPQTVLITGIKKIKQLEDNLNVFNFKLTKEEVSKLDQISINNT